MALNTDLPVLLFGQLDDFLAKERTLWFVHSTGQTTGNGYGLVVGGMGGYGDGTFNGRDAGDGWGDHTVLWDIEE